MQKPLTKSDFSIFSCQISLFYNAFQYSAAHVLKEVLINFEDKFDGEPASLPVPPDVPSDIPRVILTNKLPNLKLEVGLSRVNLFQFATANDSNLDMVSFFKKNRDIYTKFINTFKPSINRLAGVVVRYANHDDPGKLLAEHFCHANLNDRPFNRPESFELHAHKKFNLYESDEKNLIVNSWVRCKSGNIKMGTETAARTVIIEQDINTLSEQPQTFNIEQINDFYSTLPEKLNQIFGLYFK